MDFALCPSPNSITIVSASSRSETVDAEIFDPLKIVLQHMSGSIQRIGGGWVGGGGGAWNS